MYIVEKVVLGTTYFFVYEDGNPDQWVVRFETRAEAQEFVDF